jgi:hypothetical protein
VLCVEWVYATTRAAARVGRQGTWTSNGNEGFVDVRSRKESSLEEHK